MQFSELISDLHERCLKRMKVGLYPMKAPHRSEAPDRIILYSSLWHRYLDAPGYAIVGKDIYRTFTRSFGGDPAAGIYFGDLAV